MASNVRPDGERYIAEGLRQTGGPMAKAGTEPAGRRTAAAMSKTADSPPIFAASDGESLAGLEFCFAK